MKGRIWAACILLSCVWADQSGAGSGVAPEKLQQPAGAVAESWQQLMQLVRAEKLKRRTAVEEQIDKAGLMLGPWHCAGPFSDGDFSLFSACFEKAYPPEQQVIAAGEKPINLNKTWEVERSPGMLQTTGRWTRQPDWVDGFFHPLPTGPSPARNESVYLYRTITAKTAVAIDAEMIAEDVIRLWLNGRKVAEGRRSGASRFKRFLGTKLPLAVGENRLLVKITSFHGSHGFAFALPLITPTTSFRATGGTGPLPKRLQSTANRFWPGNRPYASAGRSDSAEEKASRETYWERKDGIRKNIRASVGVNPIRVTDVRVVSLGSNNLVANGSFEPNGRPGDADYVPQAPARYVANPPGSTMGGWTQTAGGVEGLLFGTFYQVPHGKQAYHLGAGHGKGSVWQSFRTIAGQKYVVSFQAAGFPGNDPLQTGSISVGDLKTIYKTPAGTDLANDMGWRRHAFFFTATGDKSTLTLGQPAGKSGTITIDDVRVAPVSGNNLIPGGSFDSPIVPDGSIARSFPTKPGETYALTFKLSGLPHSGPVDVRTVSVSVGGLDTIWTMSKGADDDADRTPGGLFFTASDSTSTLTFSNPAGTSMLFDNYVRATLQVLGLPQKARTVFPKTKDAAGVRTAGAVYHRARRYTEALARVRDFHFDVPISPMYDPPTLKMNEVLEKTARPSPGGRTYTGRLAALKARARQALAAAEQSKPGAAEAVIKAAEGIEKMWAETIRGLGPIAFIKRSPIGINAVSPYSDVHRYRPGQGEPSSICVFDPAKPEVPPRVIYHNPDGAVFDMNLSCDAKTIFFSARSKNVPGTWHIHEIGVDGHRLKQITKSDGAEISPLLLPNGELMFVSDRAGNVLVCQSPRAAVLYVANRDGSNVRRVSGNTLSDHNPQIMDDGRVLFTRWDYGMEKSVFNRQALWTMNPDGTHLALFFGNTIEDPCGFWEARPVPGRPEVVSTFGPHHSHHAGMIGLVWNRLGDEAPRGEGLRWVTRELQVISDTSCPWGYQHPFPVNEHLFLVSYGGDGERRNRIYLLDDRGNKKCIYEDSSLGCWWPLLLRPRKKPPVVRPASDNPEFAYRDPVEANRNPDSHTGAFLLQDVYEGLFPYVERGEIKSLQIMEQVPKTHPHTGGYGWGITPIIGRGTMYVRRLIGTVPVEPDGSAYFAAPATRDISFNALDADGKVIQRMGSTTQIMPGETLSCIGCHESRGTAPPQRQMPVAARRNPSVPQRPDWGTDGIVDFVQVIQPVLDKYCVECHGGPAPDGQVDLSGDKTRYFNMAYNQLVDRSLVHYVAMDNVDIAHNTPKTCGSIVSRICRYIDKEHCGKTVPLVDRRKIYTWIDANIPYYGVYHYTDGGVRGARDRWYTGKKDKWFEKDFLPVFKRRCLGCHKHTVDVSQPFQANTHLTVTSKAWDGRAIMSHGFCLDPTISLYGPAHRINLTHPQWIQVLTAPLPKQSGGLGLCKPKEGMPQPFKDTSDPDYQAMLKALQEGHKTLLAHPRVDCRSKQ